MKRSPMFVLAAGLSVFAVACAATPSSDESDEEVSGRDGALIGGQQAKDGEYPAAMMVNGSCTAAKVGPRQILIAAHCVHDTKANAVMGAYAKGQPISVTTAKHVTPENQAAVSTTLVVESTQIHPVWLQDCKGDCSVNVLGADVPPDVAVITVTKESPAIPIASVDLRPVDPNEGVVIMGYGCDEAVGADYDYSNRFLKVQSTVALPATALDHEGSYVPEGDPRYGLVAQSYVITPGQHDDTTAASLCPGDSGGPLYRDDGSQSIVVGVNAYYTFNGDGVSVTNWHTRLDSQSRFQIGAWLKGLGVQVTDTAPGGQDPGTNDPDPAVDPGEPEQSDPGGGGEPDAEPDPGQSNDCGDVDYVGQCEGDTVVWCEGTLQKIECGAYGMGCGFNKEQGFYDCVGD